MTCCFLPIGFSTKAMKKSYRKRMQSLEKEKKRSRLFFWHMISCCLTLALFQNDIWFLYLQGKPDFRCNTIHTNHSACVWVEYLFHWSIYPIQLVCWLMSGFNNENPIVLYLGSRVLPIQLIQFYTGSWVLFCRLLLLAGCFYPDFVSFFFDPFISFYKKIKKLT